MSIFPLVNLADYAVPNTSKDVTVAVQSAIDVAANAGRPLFVPAGTWLVRSLKARTGLTLWGSHPGGYGIPYAGESRFSLLAGTNAPLISGSAGVAHVRIKSMHFDGNKNNNTSGHIISLDQGAHEEAQWHIEDCFIDAAATHGVFIGYGRQAVKITDCVINYSRNCGVAVYGSDTHITRCIVGTNKEHGIGIGGVVCNVIDCDIYGNGNPGDSDTGDGICLYSTIQMAGIHMNRIDRNLRNAITLSGNNSACTIVGNVMHSNAKEGLHYGPNVSAQAFANVTGTD